MANNQFPAIKRRLKPQQAQTCHTAVPNGKNLPIISSIEAISRIFLREGPQIDIISVSDHCMHFILQNLPNCFRHKYNHFQEFLNLIFGGFLLLGPTVKLNKLVHGFLSMKRNFVCGLDDEGAVRRDAKLCTFTLCNVVDTR